MGGAITSTAKANAAAQAAANAAAASKQNSQMAAAVNATRNLSTSPGNVAFNAQRAAQLASSLASHGQSPTDLQKQFDASYKDALVSAKLSDSPQTFLDNWAQQRFGIQDFSSQFGIPADLYSNKNKVGTYYYTTDNNQVTSKIENIPKAFQVNLSEHAGFSDAVNTQKQAAQQANLYGSASQGTKQSLSDAQTRLQQVTKSLAAEQKAYHEFAKDGDLVYWQVKPYEDRIDSLQKERDSLTGQIGQLQKQDLLFGNLAGTSTAQLNRANQNAQQAAASLVTSKSALNNPLGIPQAFAEQPGRNLKVDLTESLGVNAASGKNNSLLQGTGPPEDPFGKASEATEGFTGNFYPKQNISGEYVLSPETTGKVQNRISDILKEPNLAGISFEITGAGNTEKGIAKPNEALGDILGVSNEIGKRAQTKSNIEGQPEPISISLSEIYSGIPAPIRSSNQKEFTGNLLSGITNLKVQGATSIKSAKTGKEFSLDNPNIAYKGIVSDILQTGGGSLHNISKGDYIPLINGQESKGGNAISLSIGESVGIGDILGGKNPNAYNLDVGVPIEIKTNKGVGDLINTFNEMAAPLTNVVKQFKGLASGQDQAYRSTGLDELVNPLVKAGQAQIGNSLFGGDANVLKSYRTNQILGNLGQEEMAAAKKITANDESINYYTSQIPAEVASFYLGGKAIQYGGKGIGTGLDLIKYTVKPSTNPKNIILDAFNEATKGYRVREIPEGPKNYAVSTNSKDALNNILQKNADELLTTPFIKPKPSGLTPEPGLDITASIESQLGKTGLEKVGGEKVNIQKVGDNLYKIEGGPISEDKTIYGTIGKGKAVKFIEHTKTPLTAADIFDNAKFGIISKDIGSVAQKELGASTVNPTNTEFELIGSKIANPMDITEVVQRTPVPFETIKALQQGNFIEPYITERIFDAKTLTKESQQFLDYLSTTGVKRPPIVAEAEKALYLAKSNYLPPILRQEFQIQNGIGLGFFSRDVANDLGIVPKGRGIKTRLQEALESDAFQPIDQTKEVAVAKIRDLRLERAGLRKLEVPTKESKQRIGQINKEIKELQKVTRATKSSPNVYKEKSYIETIRKGTDPLERLAKATFNKGFSFFPISKKVTSKAFDFNIKKYSNLLKTKEESQVLPKRKITKEQADLLPGEKKAYQNIGNFLEQAGKHEAASTKEARAGQIAILKEETKKAIKKAEDRQAKIEADLLKKESEELIKFREPIKKASKPIFLPSGSYLGGYGNYVNVNPSGVGGRGSYSKTNIEKSYDLMEQTRLNARRRRRPEEEFGLQFYATPEGTRPKDTFGNILKPEGVSDLSNIEDFMPKIDVKSNRKDDSLNRLASIIGTRISTTQKPNQITTPIITSITTTDTTQNQLGGFDLTFKQSQKQKLQEPTLFDTTQIFNPKEKPPPPENFRGGGFEWPNIYGLTSPGKKHGSRNKPSFFSYTVNPNKPGDIADIGFKSGKYVGTKPVKLRFSGNKLDSLLGTSGYSKRKRKSQIDLGF